MSKVLVICYRKGNFNAEADVRKAFDIIAPKNIKNDILIFQPDSSINTFIGVLNAENEINAKTAKIISGYTRPVVSEKKLSDGSYFQIKWDSEKINFNVDRFESKSLWFYQDNEKFILSNSQLLIVSLKQSFTLNLKAVSWFLSSGSTGFQNAWDCNVKKVLHSHEYDFSLKNWNLIIEKKEYAVEKIIFSGRKAFLKKYIDFTKSVFIDMAEKISVEKMILPLSGGNDSRLLFYISDQLKCYRELTLANWGVKKENNEFDDKKAAKEIVKSYNKSLKDYYLPPNIEDLNNFFDVYIKNGDCRIDHFNAYSDQFKIFENMFNEDYKFLIRGDIPFTEGLDLNDKMSRAHIGIPKLTDFENYNSYILDDFLLIQENCSPTISKHDNESLIEWRDRLYIDYRIPIVISSFDDLINSYIVTIAPMMSYSHFLLYNEEEPNKRGDKAHIVTLSKRLDQSEVSFDALPSILSMEEIMTTEKNFDYLKSYLLTMDNKIFSNQMIESISCQLVFRPLKKVNKKNAFKNKIISIAKNNLPMRVKSLIKSKNKQNISSLTLAYRMVMVDKVYKIFNQNSL